MKKKYYILIGFMLCSIIFLVFGGTKPGDIVLPYSDYVNKEHDVLKLIRIGNLFIDHPSAYSDYYDKWKPELEAAEPCNRFRALKYANTKNAYIFELNYKDGHRERYQLFKREGDYYVKCGFWNLYKISDFADENICFANSVYTYEIINKTYIERKKKEWNDGNYYIGDVLYETAQNYAWACFAEEYGPPVEVLYSNPEKVWPSFHIWK
ncbi:MAG: hypothetical protein K6E48_09065 [Lachnospiraceae bacterium]|nr:hypothetical protein [Lachnospiraceae bacterium]